MKDRLLHLDALRGFSLLGILLANMLYFQYGDVMETSINPTTWWDTVAFYVTKIAIEGSFYPIFGFLFGYSIILFLQSLERKDLHTRGPLLRRAIGLIIIGLLHMHFVWDGDILTSYGTALLIFMLFLKRQAKTLIRWGIALLTIAILATGFITSIMESLDEELEAAREVFANGTYLEVVQHRTFDVLDGSFISVIILLIIFAFVYGIIAFFAIGPFILFGLAAGKIGFLTDIQTKQSLLKKLVWLVPLGLAFKSALVIDHYVAQLIYATGTYVLAVGYMALFLTILEQPAMINWKARFANVGKLSMTNYLMQSIVWTTIYYGYGFGLFGKLGVALAMVLGIMFFALQIAFSKLYLQRFTIGPFESLLRKFVYLR